jgi:hypothetical protein
MDETGELGLGNLDVIEEVEEILIVLLGTWYHT